MQSVVAEGEAWLENPAGAPWQAQDVRPNGYVNFAPLAAPKAGKVAFAVTQIYSTQAHKASFALGSDYWFVLKVNGETYVDQGKNGRLAGIPTKGTVQVTVPLRAGWNQVVVKVASGSGGFGFWCQVADPGDLRVVPSVATPEGAPEALPPPGQLLPDPVTRQLAALYAEPLTKDEDPYAYITW